MAWAERYGGYYEQTLGFLGDSEEKEIEGQRREYERLEEMAALQASRQAALEDSARKAKRISIGLVIGLVLAVVMGGVIGWWANEAGIKAEEAHQKTLETNYNLAKVFEERATNALEDARGEEGTGADYQRAWLYTLAALGQEIPEGRLLPNSTGTLVQPDLQDNALRNIWRSSAAVGIISVAFNAGGTRLASGPGITPFGCGMSRPVSLSPPWKAIRTWSPVWHSTPTARAWPRGPRIKQFGCGPSRTCVSTTSTGLKTQASPSSTTHRFIYSPIAYKESD